MYLLRGVTGSVSNQYPVNEKLKIENGFVTRGFKENISEVIRNGELDKGNGGRQMKK